ncbi:MAG TPA: hypothetical protein VNU95_09530 [Candidatus Acidoferrales bacterium]|nr:hypothetical protein [Candidatus Acidoferrales bacterium]
MAIFLGMGASYVCAGAAGGAGGSGTAPATATGQSTPPAGSSLAPVGNGMMPATTNGMANGVTNGMMPQNGMWTGGANGAGLTNGAVSSTNYFTPSAPFGGPFGYYNLGTNSGYLRGTNGFYRPGMRGQPGKFVPDGGDLYERGPDGMYHRYNQDDTRGVYRNGVLYSPTNSTAPANGGQ